nr:pyridoxal phosphate-dependent transferase [Tanacetum cinerariifolium]
MLLTGQDFPCSRDGCLVPFLYLQAPKGYVPSPMSGLWVFGGSTMPYFLPLRGYDAITFSPHMILGGPGSPRIFLMNKVLYQLKYLPLSTCGGGTVDYVNFFDEKVT